ncbi:MAG: hypothetical protein KDC54_10135 [Lewinella sp.]|nr:hypothetical protein [Lewinella sp.]
MQVLIQQQGFRYKSFELRDEDVVVRDRTFRRELEYAVDYLDLGARTYLRTDTRQRIWQWIGASVGLIALTGGAVSAGYGGSVWPWAVLLVVALAFWSMLQLTRAPRMIYLTGGQHELELLATAPSEAAVDEFLQALREKVQEAFRAKFLADADELPKEDRKSRIEWLHEMKMISRPEKELLVAQLEDWSGKRIGFQRRSA